MFGVLHREHRAWKKRLEFSLPQRNRRVTVLSEETEGCHQEEAGETV